MRLEQHPVVRIAHLNSYVETRIPRPARFMERSAVKDEPINGGSNLKVN